MKKMAILITALMMVSVGFLSGCNEETSDETPEPSEQIPEVSITSFGLEPTHIQRGETANLTWIVANATTVMINNGIGDVNLTGTRSVTPIVNTTYTLTASNIKSTKNATTQITVDWEWITSTNITMQIFRTVDAENKVFWTVSDVDGQSLKEADVDYALIDASSGSSYNTLAGIAFINNDKDKSITSGDSFVVQAAADGTYYLLITDKATGDTIYEGPDTEY
jgi:hypothetical protein